MLAALLLGMAGVPNGALIQRVDGQVKSLAWTKDGSRLLIATDSRIREWRSGRSADLPERSDPDHFVPPDFSCPLTFNKSGTRAIGFGYVMDVGSLKAIRHRRGSARWIGDKLVIDPYVSDGKVIRNGVRIAPKWYVLGPSPDGMLALATREAPFLNDTTYLLRINPRSGASKVIARFPQSSDDHVALAEVERNTISGKLVIHSVDAGSGSPRAYFAAPTLEPIRFPLPPNVFETSCWAEWIPGERDWLTVRRRLFHERDNGASGFDATLLDLWNWRTQRMIRVAKVVTAWKGTGAIVERTQEIRAEGDNIGAYHVDFKRRQIAYSINGPKKSKVYLFKLPKH